MSKSSASDQHPRLVVAMIDGSTVAATAFDLTGPVPRVIDARLRELPETAERVESLTHPIFQSVLAIRFPDAALVREALLDVLDGPDFAGPLLGVFPGDYIQRHHATGPATPPARAQRRRTLFARIGNPNPAAFPVALSFHETPVSRGLSTTSLAAVRAPDVSTVAAQFDNLGRPFLGLVTAPAAARALVDLVRGDTRDRPVTVLSLGKMRTLHVIHTPNGRGMENFIPVGMLRIDAQELSSMPASVEELLSIRDRVGGMLLYPVMATPSPLMRVRKSTIPLDCTRFAREVALFVSRAFDRLPDLTDWEGTAAPVNYVVGRASRITGLVNYIQDFTEETFHSFEERPPTGIEVASHDLWRRLTDAPETVGGALAWLHRGDHFRGLLIRERKMKRALTERINPAEFEDNTIYVLDRLWDTIAS